MRLDHDLKSRDALAAYVVTPQVQEVVRRTVKALRPNSADRAWTITGPYGTGKSACGLFLACLTGFPDSGGSGDARSILREQAPAVAEELEEVFQDGRGLFPVVVTLRRAPVTFCLAEALLDAMERLPDDPHRKALADRLRAALEARALDSRALVDRVRELMQLANVTGRYKGALIILDELGKTLEHAARHEADDIYILQELAEFAQRSNDHPLLVIGILHQSFESYAAQVDSLARHEWGKAQGRFADIAFLEPVEQLVRLAGRAVASVAPSLGVSADLRSKVERVAAALPEHRLAPRHMGPAEFRTIASAAAPLHPLTLLSLPYLFRRLAQNERSMFVYLAGQEPFGLQDLARSDGKRLIRLPDLYDYCTANVGGLLAGQVVSRHWIEVGDAIDRAPDLSELQVQCLKTVGLLGILGEFSHLKPTREAICLAVDDAPFSAPVRAALEELRARSLLTFRRFDSTYRIWEGSDIDVEEALEEARRKTGQQLDLTVTLSRYLPRRPIVARRHSYESGAIRYFEVQYLQSPTVPAQVRPTGEADGVVALCLPESQAQTTAFRDWASDSSADWPTELVVVVPTQMRGLREAAGELRALNWVWDNTLGFRDDRVARRELAERTALAEQSLGLVVESLLDPRPEPLGSHAYWFSRGARIEAESLTSAMRLLSSLMDELYSFSPRIHNELVNRRTLSSAAAAARRTLIDRMLSHSGEKLLGMSGYAPERSMYESVLLDSGLHREEDGIWMFGPPPDADPRRLGPVWGEMHRIVFNPASEAVRVDQLFARLSAPPFGATPGGLPILLAAFLLAYSDEISLYRKDSPDQEGRFVPEPAIVDFEVLMRRPELFAVAGSRVAGERAAVVQRMAKALRVEPAIVPVVRALVRAVRSLPDSSWRTRRLSESVIALRRAFEQTASPERLLFSEIPLAVGEAPFTDEGLPDATRIERFFDRVNAALTEWSQFSPGQLAWARDTLLRECGLPPTDGGWYQLVGQARGLVDQPIHTSLVPFVRRLAGSGDERAVLESVLALVAGKPPKSWLDSDVDQYPLRAREIGERFRYAYDAHAPLTPEEVAATQRLVGRLRSSLDGIPSTRVARSALAALLAELSPQSGGQP